MSKSYTKSLGMTSLIVLSTLVSNGIQERSKPDEGYLQAVERTASMVGNDEVRSAFAQHKLDLLNLTWEDTGRFKNSAVGPNISDMTIQVGIKQSNGRFEAHLMPVIRFPNFSDITGEADPRAFTLLVGNEKGKPLRRVSLYDYLANPSLFMSKAASWGGRVPRTLLAPRDTKVLVSAQACFLPVPKGSKATFNPVLFNYQSMKGDPGVAALLASREGSSITVTDPAIQESEGWNWGQRLYHNMNGERASFTGQRMSDYVEGGRQGPKVGGVKTRDEALNMVLLIQIPLKQKPRGRYKFEGGFGGGAGGADMATPSMAPASPAKEEERTENAVISFGDIEGPFTEFNNLPIERDPNFPVRVTIQFYQATTSGQPNRAEIDRISNQIENVYKGLSDVGSLVTGGETGRATEYYGSKVQPQSWWNDFWADYEQTYGISRHVARRRLRELIGKDYPSRPVCRLYLENVLRQP
ncbi:MAG: hypothetical protein JST40_02480 [Armatimonadetes bacterium]|nr:hypothetical protein [Armatimonadota bacterium]